VIIETQGLRKKFWRHDAVQDVNLAVPEGATCALVGANGAGKTTLMRMLVNILAPDSGSAQVLGVDSRRLAPTDFFRIGYVSENQVLPERLAVLRLPSCALSRLGRSVRARTALEFRTAASARTGQALTWHAHEGDDRRCTVFPSEAADPRRAAERTRSPGAR
jgi:ABC-type Mn2+/Zn2+ transport system ATPase subunit